MARELKTFQIFRSGTHVAMNGTKINFSEQDLKKTVDAYKQTVWSARWLSVTPSQTTRRAMVMWFACL